MSYVDATCQREPTVGSGHADPPDGLPPHDAATDVRQHDHHEQDATVSVGTVKKSIDAADITWFVRNVFQRWGEGRACGASSRETVRSET